jgi:catechol 2,3-dioxygenase-like lactoylglutathione lyase family enzyme
MMYRADKQGNKDVEKGSIKMILGLHHAQITIPKGNEEEGKRFYCGVLGLEETEKPDSLKARGGFWLQLGSQQLHVGTEPGVDRSATKAHLAYQVSNLSFWREKLIEENIEIIDAVPITGFERFEFRDPFGNRVELIEELK